MRGFAHSCFVYPEGVYKATRWQSLVWPHVNGLGIDGWLCLRLLKPQRVRTRRGLDVPSEPKFSPNNKESQNADLRRCRGPFFRILWPWGVSDLWGCRPLLEWRTLPTLSRSTRPARAPAQEPGVSTPARRTPDTLQKKTTSWEYSTQHGMPRDTPEAQGKPP